VRENGGNNATGLLVHGRGRSLRKMDGVQDDERGPNSWSKLPSLSQHIYISRLIVT
jgi:hypothetical protein